MTDAEILEQARQTARDHLGNILTAMTREAMIDALAVAVLEGRQQGLEWVKEEQRRIMA